MLKLQAGKKYRCRDGEVITLSSNSGAATWLQGDGEQSYINYCSESDDGWKVFPFSGDEDPKDIMEEVTDDLL